MSTVIHAGCVAHHSEGRTPPCTFHHLIGIWRCSEIPFPGPSPKSLDFRVRSTSFRAFRNELIMKARCSLSRFSRWTFFPRPHSYQSFTCGIGQSDSGALALIRHLLCSGAAVGLVLRPSGQQRENAPDTEQRQPITPNETLGTPTRAVG